MAIMDSGERTVFNSGAVRDMKEGKGRMDLTPLDVVAKIMDDSILEFIYNFQQDNSRTDLLYAILGYVSNIYDFGFKKDTEDECDKISYESTVARNANMILDVSKHFEEGALKYGEDNWRAGIPIKSYIDSACRHYLKVLRGDTDEPHDRAFVWNIMCLIWTAEHKEELNIEG